MILNQERFTTYKTPVSCLNNPDHLSSTRTTVHPVPHIGDEAGDRGRGIGLFERPVNYLHHPVIILRESVVARLELLDGHVPRPHDHSAAILAVELTANKLIDWSFNYLLYPGIIYLLGIWRSDLIMTFLSFLLCILCIWFYDWSKKDWLGIETIKALKDYEGGHSAGRMTSWFLRRSEPVAFLFLTFWYDPLITMAYMRRGAYNGMGAHDWHIFLISLFLGNGYWILANWMGVSLLEYLWGRWGSMLRSL